MSPSLCEYRSIHDLDIPKNPASISAQKTLSIRGVLQISLASKIANHSYLAILAYRQTRP